MGYIEITSDGTLAGTVVADATTHVAITGVVSVALSTTIVDAVPVLQATLVVRQPVLVLAHAEGLITYEALP